jgi:hypothetical protein
MMNTQFDNHSIDREARQLQKMISILKRRGQLLTVVSGTVWVATGSIFFVLALVAALGWWGGSGLRALGWIVTGIGVLSIAIGTLVLPLMRLTRRAAVAKRIGDIDPSFASDILTATELAGETADNLFSPVCVVGHLRTARKALSSMPRDRVFSTRSLTLPTLALAFSIALGTTAVTAMPRVIETGLASLWMEPLPPSRGARPMVAKAPVVSDLIITLRYPEYLNRQERRLEVVSGGLVAPLGTTVVLQGKSLVPGANQGMVTLPNGDQSSLSMSTDGVVKGSFVIGTGGPFFISMGTKSAVVKGPERHLEIETDSPPSIRLLRPLGQIEVAEDGVIDIEFEAEDDYGLRHVDLVLRASPNFNLRKTIIRLADGVKRFRTKYSWTPESIRLADDTDVQLELETFDNDSILGPKSGHSEPLDVHILTPQSRHKNAVADQGKALDKLVDLLANRLEKPPMNSREGKAAIERFTVLRRETEDILGQSARLINALNNDPLTPRRVIDTFAQIREDLSNQLLYENRLYDLPLAEFRKRKSVNGVMIRLLENAVIHIDDLIIEQQLSKLISKGDSLDQQQNKLAKLLDNFIQTRAESSRRALLDTIGQIEETIRQLQQEMEIVRGKISDTFINESSLNSLDLAGSLDRLRAFLAEGNLHAATLLIRSLKSDFSRLMAGLEGGLLSFRTNRFGEGERFLDDLLNKVMAIEVGQLQLRRETTALQRRYQERLVEIMRNRIDSLVKKQMSRVRKINEILANIDSPSSETGRIRLVRLRISARELRLALGQGDLDEARQIASEIAEQADSLPSGGRYKKLNNMPDVKRLAQELGAEIKNAYPKPGQLFSKHDRRLTRGQANQQRHLSARTRKAKKWIGDQDDATRFLSHRATSGLKTVALHMSRATSFLEESNVRRALAEQSAALDELIRLREDMKRGDEISPIKSRPIVLRGRIELPDPDDYKVPPEFRDDILKAMHGDLPNQYEDAIKRYYENLVQ